MKTLVTGGAGFVGSHLADALVAAGDDVLVLDDLSNGRRENLESALAGGARLEQLDVAEAGQLLPAIVDFAPEAVFHLAAQIDVRKSMEDPGFDARVNVTGTLNVLEASARAGASKLIFTSTGGAIYGEGQGREDDLPFNEQAACEPFSIYGQSKLAAEGYVDLYRRTRGLESVVLRLGNVYGPRQDPSLEAGVVAIFCELARDGGRPTVFGTGEQTRDYVHVADVVSALVAARDGAGPGPFNVATGAETSVLALADSVGRMAGRDDFQPNFEPRRDGEVERTYLDISLAAKRLGWAPSRSLDDGIRETLEAGA